MKKAIIRAIIPAFIAVWAIRYSYINNGFSIRTYMPVKYFSMGETVDFADNASYDLVYNDHHSISVEDAYIAETNELIAELNKDKSFFHSPAERYLILTLKITNNSDNEEPVDFYSIPVMGKSWYVLRSTEMTAYLNPFYNDDVSVAGYCRIRKGESATVKVAYSLYKNLFSPKQWKSLEKQDMWLWATTQPLDQRIKIDL